MKTDGIIRVKNLPKSCWDSHVATGTMRKYITKNLGKLDTATSFMYLFAKFGTPDQSNADEYKILYSYDWLRCDDLFFSIHASYHEFVYFNFHFQPKYEKAWRVKRKKTLKRIITQQIKKGIPFADPYDDGWEKFISKQNLLKNDALFDEYARKYLSESDYRRLDEATPESVGEAEVKLYNDLIRAVYEDFLNSLSESDREEYSDWRIKLDDIPEIKLMLDKLIAELRTVVYIRDVPINILGYE